MTKNVPRKRIEQIENLPTLPEVANRLMRIINDPITTAADVANLIARDPSLTSKVLRLANSAFYGIPRTVTTVHNAVVILGLKVINTMVFSITVVKMFPGDGREEALNRKRFWAHCLACAVLTKLLAQRMRRVTLFDPEECFCAGLIHDIGRVVLDQYFHEEFAQAFKRAGSEKISLGDAETQVLGFSHTDAGEWLTARWELPHEIRIPIIYHHRPSEAPQAADVTALVHMADVLCYQIDFGTPGIECPPKLDAGIVEQLGFSEEELAQLRAEALEDIDKFKIVLEI